MTRLAILGIDGATFDVIRPMMAAGELPHLRRVMEEGASGLLRSESPPTSPPAWTSMMTGLNPGRHGVFHFIRRVPGTYQVELVDSRVYAGKDIMSVLARRGWRTGALGVPMTYPPFPLEGGWIFAGIPMPLSGETYAWPREMAAETRDFLGHHYRPDVDFAPFGGDVEREEEDLSLYGPLRDQLFEVERERISLAKEWLQRHPTELFFVVLSITDRTQHYFWRFHDPAHPAHTEEGRRLYGEVVRDAYRLADGFVGEMRELLGDAAVCLVSDHGFGPYTTDFHINNWLEETGLLVRRRPPYWTTGRTNVAGALSKLGLEGVGRALGPVGRIPLVRPKRKRLADFRDVDWTRTRAFCALHGICVNLAGREPQGIVQPGEEYRQTLAEIARLLKELRGPGGEPAVDFIVKAEDIYDGEHVPEAPDLQFQMMGLACLPKDDWDHPELFQERRTAPISGQHRFDGIFALAGPGVAPGVTLEGMHIQDTAPTLLHAVGERVPGWMEGRVQVAVLRDGPDPEYDHEEEPRSGASGGAAFSDDEAASVEDSLRGLGYIQ